MFVSIVWLWLFVGSQWFCLPIFGQPQPPVSLRLKRARCWTSSEGNVKRRCWRPWSSFFGPRCAKNSAAEVFRSIISKWGLPWGTMMNHHFRFLLTWRGWNGDGFHSGIHAASLPWNACPRGAGTINVKWSWRQRNGVLQQLNVWKLSIKNEHQNSCWFAST